MKIILYSLVVLMAGHAAAQKHFRIKSDIGDTVKIIVNGKPYIVTVEGIKIPTLYPEFDSLNLMPGLKFPNIVCNFKPDSLYSIIPACCATLDVVPAWKLRADSLKYWDDYERDFEKIQQLLMDKSRFVLRIKNGSERDSIYGWYADWACFPSIKLMNEEGWNYGTPVKCFYWSNISYFSFFQTHRSFYDSVSTEGVIHDVFPPDEAKRLGSVAVRFFDDDEFVITYDVKKQKLTAEYAVPPKMKPGANRRHK